MDGDWVTIIHPETGGTGTVHKDSLTHHYRSGWRLLTDDEQTARDAPEPDPEPVTRTQAAKTAQDKAASAAKEN